MQGSSRVALADAQQRLRDAARSNTLSGLSGAPESTMEAVRNRLSSATHIGGLDLSDVADGMLGVTDLLDSQVRLRRALSDASMPVESKAALVDSLLGSQLDRGSMEVLHGLVASRWSAAVDLVDATELIGVQALFLQAEGKGTLDDVEDEIFRFARVLDREPALLAALTDTGAEASRREELARGLLEGRAKPQTLRLVSYLLTHLRGRPLDRALEDFAQLAATSRTRLLAQVRVAVPMTEAQTDRLTAALERMYGAQVHLQVEVDPTVVGGVSVRVGDDLIDGTVATRVATARRTIDT